MQLPLSASALALLGVVAVVAGVLVLVVLAVRRRMAASGAARGPADRFVAREAGGSPESASQPVVAAGPAEPAATSAVPDPAGRASIPATRANEPARRDELPGSAAPGGQVPEPLARPPEVSARVDPPSPGGGEEVRPAQVPAAQLGHQTGSGRTVAAAVAQAFAVRAAAGRTAPSGPPADDGAAEDGAASSPESPPPAPVQPLATPDVGRDPDADVPLSPEPTSDAGAPEPWQPEETGLGADGNGRLPAAVAGAGLWTTGRSAVPPATASEQAAPDAVPVSRPEHHGAASPAGDSPASDARDRLLAVLLDDPERAVGATVELEACLRELDRLSDAVRRERATLRDVLHRLAAAGLHPEQLARLAGMPLAEVEELLGAARAE